MIYYKTVTGSSFEVAETITSFYNNKNVEIVNIVYSTFFEDIFQCEPTHYAIVFYKEK